MRETYSPEQHVMTALNLVKISLELIKGLECFTDSKVRYENSTFKVYFTESTKENCQPFVIEYQNFIARWEHFPRGVTVNMRLSPNSTNYMLLDIISSIENDTTTAFSEYWLDRKRSFKGETK